MTIKDIFEKNAVDKGWLNAPDVIKNAQYATIWLIIDATCRQYAKLMCDKQKQICADNALMEQHTGQGKSLVNYVIGQDILHSKDELFISKHSIENSPYPEELQ